MILSEMFDVIQIAECNTNPCGKRPLEGSTGYLTEFPERFTQKTIRISSKYFGRLSGLLICYLNGTKKIKTQKLTRN